MTHTLIQKLRSRILGQNCYVCSKPTHEEMLEQHERRTNRLALEYRRHQERFIP